MSGVYLQTPKGQYIGVSDERYLQLKTHTGSSYWIDLYGVRREDDVNFWYDHLAQKSWVSIEMLGELLFTMNEWIFQKAPWLTKQERKENKGRRVAQARAVHPERQKMRPSVRFRILQRDGFKCVLCGRAASEGAKLHVDHKVAIANGGKTEDANLHTLCEDCNLGKGVQSL